MLEIIKNNLTLVDRYSATNEDAQIIVNSLTDLVMASLSKDHGKSGLVDKFSLSGNYVDENKLVKETLLKYCTDAAGVSEIVDKKTAIRAFENSTFETVYNSIVVEALSGVMTRTQAPALLAMANEVTVDVGDTYTWEIDSKGLPVAQRASYMSNVAFLDGDVAQSITIAPKVYSVGAKVDYIRIYAGDYDMGKEIGKSAMAMLYAKYKLVANIIFDTGNAPFMKATFDQASYVKMGSDLRAVNGGSDVTAYGTTVALNKMGALATTSSGFATQDEQIRNGRLLGNVYGINTVLLDQATDLSSPFVGGVITGLIPENVVVLLSGVGDKPVKIVSENMVRARRADNTTGALNRLEYNYFTAFDAGLCTQAHYGVQSV